ncbi:MAG: hypothetical protein QOJ08_927 [Ilumatobacteraceae bacterium]
MTRQRGAAARQGQRRPPAKRATPVDIWRDPGPLPEIEPITIPSEAGALLRSLGDPPLLDGSTATKYFTTVIQRAAVIAAALALSADVLAHPEEVAG